ncbi:LD-carboxypeptidase [Rickettsiales bacterium]|nr:LD-carboxypeptidase [Rickettsiales bacterium]MDB2550370.1 LD-carboxypeptidase [Rickettsiales bacterium]
MKLAIKRPNNWPILKNNSKIHVIFPAFACNNDEKLKIKQFLKNWNLEAIFYDAQEINNLTFLANSDQDRLNELKNSLNSDNSDIIFCASGGYGSSRIIPQLLQSSIAVKNKLFLGFSDITSLHLAFNNYFKIPTLHSPMLKQMAQGDIGQKSIDFLYQILTQQELELFYNICPLNDLAKNISNINLPQLLGGNLSLIQTSIGTNWQINKNGKYCMLIEEYDEKSYAIDRMLNHLQNANIFDNCQAIFIGDISKIENHKYLTEILNSFISNINIPIFKIDDIGHENQNLAIPLGVEVMRVLHN